MKSIPILLILLGTLSGILTSPLPANATLIVPLSLDKLSEQSTAIALGRSVEAQSVWQEGIILTRVKFVVEDIWKGPLNHGDTIEITLQGGTIPPYTQYIPHSPSLPIGKTRLVFLHKRGATWTIYGFSQGVVPITSPPPTETEGPSLNHQATIRTAASHGTAISLPLQTLYHSVQEILHD